MYRLLDKCCFNFISLTSPYNHSEKEIKRRNIIIILRLDRLGCGTRKSRLRFGGAESNPATFAHEKQRKRYYRHTWSAFLRARERDSSGSDIGVLSMRFGTWRDYTDASIFLVGHSILVRSVFGIQLTVLKPPKFRTGGTYRSRPVRSLSVSLPPSPPYRSDRLFRLLAVQ